MEGPCYTSPIVYNFISWSRYHLTISHFPFHAQLVEKLWRWRWCWCYIQWRPNSSMTLVILIQFILASWRVGSSIWIILYYCFLHSMLRLDATKKKVPRFWLQILKIQDKTIHFYYRHFSFLCRSAEAKKIWSFFFCCFLSLTPFFLLRSLTEDI